MSDYIYHFLAAGENRFLNLAAIHKFGDIDGHLGRNFLKGRKGDHFNAVMSAVGYNLRLILKWLKALLRIITAAILVDVMLESKLKWDS